MKFLMILILFVCVVYVAETKKSSRSGRWGRGRGRSSGRHGGWKYLQLLRRVSELETLFQNQSVTLQDLIDQLNMLPTQQDYQNLTDALQSQADEIQACKDQITELESCTRPGTLRLYTPNMYNYQVIDDEDIRIPGNTSVVFEVKACSDAHIALLQSSASTTTNIYEIVIGGWSNSRSVIRDQQQGPLLADTSPAPHQPLNCNEFLPFWISWDQGTIRVGSGLTVGSGEFLSYVDPTPTDVNYVAVSTWTTSDGLWNFFDNDCLA